MICMLTNTHHTTTHHTTFIKYLLQSGHCTGDPTDIILLNAQHLKSLIPLLMQQVKQEQKT